MATNLPPFPEELVVAAFKKADGRCQCRDRSHPSIHTPAEYCNRELVWDERDGYTDKGGWSAHHLASSAGPVRENLIIYCTDCHELLSR